MGIGSLYFDLKFDASILAVSTISLASARRPAHAYEKLIMS